MLFQWLLIDLRCGREWLLIHTPIDTADPLVHDTRVLINLHACKYRERILAAMPNDTVIPDIVAGELEHETSRRNGEFSFLNSIIANGIAALVK
jgi:hypothetical protein